MVTRLLERAIEIEGLLRVIRDGNPLPETFSLLNEKAIELAERVSLLVGSPQIINDTQSHNDEEDARTAKETAIDGPMIIMPADHSEENGNDDGQKNESPKEILISLDAPKPQPEEEAQENLSEDDEEDAEETADIEIGATEIEQEEEVMVAALEVKDNEDEDDDIVLSLDEDEEADDEKPSSNRTSEDETIIEIKDDEEHVSTTTKDELLIDATETERKEPEIEGRQKPKENTNYKKKGSLKSAFSLNDRFLYSRELFDGNMKMFDSTLEFLNDIDNQSMIEDYFYNEMGWDKENETVKAFMEIIELRILN